MKSPNFIKIVEVGPRDGLQNEKTIIPTNVKVDFINQLSLTGLRSIEATSFVSPKWVPQMADNFEVFTTIKKEKHIDYPVLVPNLFGLEKAIEAGIKECAVFVSASESFAQKNTNCSIKEGFEKAREVILTAKNNGIRVRGYLSCVISCPYEGKIDPEKVAVLSKKLLDLGCYEISLGDTIGVGTPGDFSKMLEHVIRKVPSKKVAVHCHDTYGQALSNIFLSIDRYKIRTVDCSVSGLGGCPFAKDATGNVATEDVVYMLNNSGYETGIDIKKLINTGNFISNYLKRKNGSKAASALSKSDL